MAEHSNSTIYCGSSIISFLRNEKSLEACDPPSIEFYLGQKETSEEFFLRKGSKDLYFWLDLSYEALHRLAVDPRRPVARTRRVLVLRPTRELATQIRLIVGKAAGWSVMADETESLDEHRGMAAQQATEARRRSSEVIRDQLVLKERREALEKLLFAERAESWDAAVAKARYLLALFADTPTADDPRYRTLIEQLLADFDRLLLATATANDNDTRG